MRNGIFRERGESGSGWTWLSEDVGYVLAAVQEHVTLTLVALGGGLVIAVPLGILAHRRPRLRVLTLSAFGAFYTIPSIALFALLIPYTGLTGTTAEIPLLGYNVLILVRNILVGLDAVPPDVLDPAHGLAYRALPPADCIVPPL